LQNASIKGAVSNFWEKLLRVDQTRQLNTLVANQQQGVCPFMMRKERKWARGRFEERL